MRRSVCLNGFRGIADLGLRIRSVPSVSLLCLQNLPDSDEREIKWTESGRLQAQRLVAHPALLFLATASPSPAGVYFWVFLLQKGGSPHRLSPENPVSSPSLPCCKGITAAE